MCGTALAQSGNPTAPEPLILTDAQSEYLLGLHMELLEDPTGKLTIEDVSSPEFDSQFIPCQDETPNFGFSTSAYWVRLRLDNETRRTVDWLLEVDFANTHFVDLYTPLLNGEGFEVRQTGQLRPVSTRDVLHPNIVFNLFVPTLSQQTTYLRFQNGGSMTLPLTLWTKDAFLTNTAQEHLMHGLFYGILICLLIYNLFLLFSLRESSYLYFVIALASMVFFFSSYDGYMEVYVIPNLYYLIQQYMVISWSILFLSIILFTDTFLEIKTQIPKIHRVNIALTGVWGVLILLAPFNNYHFMATLVLPLALISLIVVLGAGIASFQRGFHPARLYLIAWSGLCVTLIIAMLARAGAIPITSFSENLFRLGGIWLGVSWSLALANRINLLKAETEDANRGLQQNQHRLAQILEGLPIGVMVYGQNRKPTYFNQRLLEILNYPKRGVEPDLTAGRTLEEAHKYFSFRVSGSDQEYPLENMPVSQAFEGVTASADDIEADTKERRVPLEVWASPVRDDQGQVESVVSAVLDITQRQKDEAELNEYRRHLEQLVDDRTAQLVVINEVLQSEIGEKERLQGELHLRLEWLVAANLANQTVIRKSDLPRVYQNFVEIIPKLFGAAAAFIAELDPDSAGGELQDEIKPRAGTGLRPGFVIRAHCARNGALPLKNIVSNSIGAVISLPPAIPADSFFSEGTPAIFSRAQLSKPGEHMDVALFGPESEFILLAPLRFQERAVGFLGLESHDENLCFSDSDTALLEKVCSDIAQIEEKARLLEQSQILTAAEERNRLARDLHDSVTQTLFTASVLAEATPRIWDKNQKIARQNMDKLSMLIRGALAEMRAMLIELRSGELHNQTLDRLLITLVEAARARTNSGITISMMDIPELPENVTLAIYRMAREALNNAIIHASASQIDVSLLAEPDQVKVRIKDNGGGFDPQTIPAGHLGLKIMLERAAGIGGELQIHSEPGFGTQIDISWSKSQEGQ